MSKNARENLAFIREQNASLRADLLQEWRQGLITQDEYLGTMAKAALVEASAKAALVEAERLQVIGQVPAGWVIELPPTTPINALAWQPMETAPRDGETVLAWSNVRGIAEVSWSASHGYWIPMFGYGFLEDEVQAWAPKPAGPSFGAGVQS